MPIDWLPPGTGDVFFRTGGKYVYVCPICGSTLKFETKPERKPRCPEHQRKMVRHS